MKTLLEKVRAIDKDAADYIQSEVLPRYEVEPSLLPKVARMSVDGQLSALFIWGESPQGADYWRKIYKQLGE